MNVDRLLGSHFKPETPVFILAQTPIDQSQFYQAIASLAASLQTTQQQRWALCFNDSYRFIITLLAVLVAQKQPVILPNNQLGTLLALQNEYDAILSDLPGIEVTPLDQAGDERLIKPLSLSPQQQIIFFTSGSTGEPKKIQRSLAATRHEIDILEATFGPMMQNATIYSTVSHQHIYGLLFYLLWPLYVGRSIVCPIAQYPENLETIFHRTEKTVVISSPTLLSRLDIKMSHAIQPIIFSSGSLLKDTVAQALFANLGLSPIEILGSTETGAVAFRQQLTQPLWQPLPQVSVSQDTATGCLTVQSPFFDEEEAFIMGDQIEMQTHGLFKWIGRADRIVKIEGKRLSLNAIEQKIKEYPLIADVYALMMDAHRQLLATAIILNEKGQALLQEMGKRHFDQLLQSWLLHFYEAVLCPKKIRYVDQWPVNAQGKVTQQALQQLFEAQNV